MRCTSTIGRVGGGALRWAGRLEPTLETIIARWCYELMAVGWRCGSWYRGTGSRGSEAGRGGDGDGWWWWAAAINGCARQGVYSKCAGQRWRRSWSFMVVMVMVWQREEEDGWESDLILWGRPLLPFGEKFGALVSFCYRFGGSAQ